MSSALNKWTEKLLDLSKRNKLINFKDSRFATIPTVFPDIDTVFSKIISNKNLEVFDIDFYISKNYKEKYTEEKMPSIEQLCYSDDPESVKLKEKIKPAQILLYKKGVNTLDIVENIAKKSRDNTVETGINSLYMAFGFAHWTEPKSDVKYLAPLILIPITLTNGSVLDPYVIRLYEDEIITNPTFVYKLKTESGIELPQMDEDEKLSEYLDKIKKLIEPLSWTVTNEIQIGMFSFLKMNMYLDLKNNQSKVLSNKLSRSLVYDNADDNQPDEKYKPELAELHNVVDADSSQTQAIKLAKQGASFVLQGPPGTGKSQTITNIIAECLYDNKKILFVSEKLAALNVVYNNLKKADLDDFCLELHSHKTNKKEVITELNRVLTKTKINVSNRASYELDILEKTKSELDGYVNELHKKNAVIGLSAYELYGESAKVKNAADMDLNISDIETKGEKHLANASELFVKYTDYTQSIGSNYKNNEWYGFINYDVSYGYKKVLAQKLKEILEPVKTLFVTQNVIKDKFGLDVSSISQLNSFLIYLNGIKNVPVHIPNIYIKDNLLKMQESFNNAKILSVQINKIIKELDAVFNKEIYNYDFSKVYGNFINYHSKFFNRLKKTYKADIGLLNSSKLKPNYNLSFSKSIKFIEKLVKLKALKEEFFKDEEFLIYCFNDNYQGFNTDWDTYLELLDILDNGVKNGINFMPLSKTDPVSFKTIKEGAGVLIKRIQSESEAANNSFKLLKKYFDDSCDFQNSNISDTILKLQKCIDNVDDLENWATFNKLLKEMDKIGLKQVVDYFIEKNFVIQDYINIYKKQFFKQWIHYILFSNSTLSEFNRVAQDRNINLFTEKDKLQFEISKAQINAKLSGLRPSLDIIPAGSQISILLREGEKKRKLMPVRVLLSKTANIAQLLKPCFLMSPLSVSTFLDSDYLKFDIVIFDEASQIFPEDALGSIYRSRQVIVVGDSKQMPPTNFFNAIINDDEYNDENETFDEDVKDYESILDICATRFKQDRLKWHYRSRCEDLIVFSNKNFYNNELVTFPSAKTKTANFGVEFYNVPDGIFDRKTKTNVLEAEYMANMVFNHFKEFPDRSLGVVAFSQSQQEAIEKIILKLRKKDTSFEKFFRFDVKEPFFIKNLETVQGDERDTIILGVGYAKDSAGKFLHNFGPLNRQGGERRLNVAITRAKQNLKLVASITRSDIDLTRSKTIGTKLLKEYLHYAQFGYIAPENNVPQNEKAVFDFETEIYDFLTESGFKVDKQIGRSGYQIDLAVRNPKKQDYIIAIECDGPIYQLQKSARDRDRLRKEVLERMGWNFYRIWSTDWIKNNRIEKQRLFDYVDSLLKDETIKSKKDSSPETIAQKTETAGDFMVENNTQKTLFSEYVFADIAKLKKETKASVANKINFQNFIKRIVSIESPVSEEWLLKRIVFMFDREKVTSAVKADYQKLMSGITGIMRKNGFLYDCLQTDFKLRISKDGEEQREIKYISLEELEDGLMAVIKQNIQLETDSLFKALSKSLGFSRIGAAVAERLDIALTVLKNMRLIEISGTLVSLKR